MKPPPLMEQLFISNSFGLPPPLLLLLWGCSWQSSLMTTTRTLHIVSQPASQVSPHSPSSIHPVQDQHRASWIVRWRSSIVVGLSVWVGVVVQLGCVSCLHCQCLVCCGGPRIAKLTSVCRLFFSLIQFNTRLEMCISSFSAVCSAASN